MSVLGQNFICSIYLTYFGFYYLYIEAIQIASSSGKYE